MQITHRDNRSEYVANLQMAHAHNRVYVMRDQRRTVRRYVEPMIVGVPYIVALTVSVLAALATLAH